MPGCSGSGTLDTDYCIDREPDKLAVIANNGSPSELFPLGNCEGDCDNDSECQSGLTCVQVVGTDTCQ